MNRSSRLLASALLTSTLVANLFAPSFAQYTNYNNKPYSQNYNNGYNQNYNQNSYSSYNNSSVSPLKGHVVTVPMGTPINAVAQSELSSDTLTVGDTVAVMVGNNFYYNGSLVLPAGSSIQGNVVLAEKSSYTGKAGKLKIKFTNAITPSGQRIPLSGKISTPDGTGLLVGGTNTQRVTNAAKNGAAGAALGAIVGTFMGPLSGGKVGKGAVYGTAVGGGLGLGKSLIDKGNDATIPAGSNIDIVLDQPATINMNQQSYDY